jgi:hypothetical protein
MNLRELSTAEVRRIPLLGTSVNKEFIGTCSHGTAMEEEERIELPGTPE